MKFVVAFAALVCVASAGFGESRCHEGPSYWCENKDTATECAAMEFCAQNFWQEESEVEVCNLQFLFYYSLSPSLSLFPLSPLLQSKSSLKLKPLPLG